MTEGEARELADEIMTRFHHPLYCDIRVEVEEMIGGGWKITVI